MLKVTRAGSALVGNAVGVPMGCAVGACAGQYQILDVVGCVADEGYGVEETEGGGLMKGGALSLSSSSSSSSSSVVTPQVVGSVAVKATSPVQVSLLYLFCMTAPARKHSDSTNVLV
jgi:hypothetical protein